ncbi:cation:proton antiporter [Saccharospirillum alexandrii]|uniref:cation:proton antiporter n=1 Tax=Saccharospirillum alexandrii TaxID=2448477 RepID=UPI000FD912CF|nr:cation:proton antiporter [Saccharospirillum alexandrii]
MNSLSLPELPSAYSLFLVGVLMIFTLLVRGVFIRRFMPLLVIYIGVGTFLGWLNTQVPLLDQGSRHSLGLLAEAGLVLLVFKVGLESDLSGLLKQLPNASWIWLWNVLFSGALGFAAAYYLVSFSLLTSIFVGVALTATSLGVTVTIWQDAKQLTTERGNLFVDVAELDDISSIVLMAILVALAPLLASGESIAATDVGLTLAKVLSTLIMFVSACWVFSVYFEKRLTQFVERYETRHEPMVLMLSIGFIIAALAEVSGLSLAVGAFLAGLAFSRDTAAAKERVVFNGLYVVFTPFFFIGLGLHIDLTAFSSAFWPGVVLLAAAVAGKLLGTCLPAYRRLGGYGALLIGVSMIPRAEIAMVIMQKALEAGAEPKAFTAMMVVTVGTVLLTSLTLPRLMRREK